jgi:uncharacterized repeat protein (TIGR01451 family)
MSGLWFRKTLFAAMIILGSSFASTVQLQTPTNCNDKGSIAGGPVVNPTQSACQNPPTDVGVQDSWSGDPGQRVVCKNCLPSGSRFNTAGTPLCENYGRQLVIEFLKPVANLHLPVFGARTVTDNRGMTIKLTEPQPSQSLAYFPGTGITRITITDPYINSQGEWNIWVSNFHWTPGAVYSQCNCGRPAIATPAPQSPESPDWNNNGIPDWRMDAEISPTDGLVLKNVQLENRYMAEKMSAPYYSLQTNSFPAQRGELKPNSNDSQMASRLVDFQSWSDDNKLVVEATYVIDKIPAGSTNCLEIVQRYEFYKRVPGDQCEPTGTVPCARWKPIVRYKYLGPENDLQSINVAQRFHYRVNGFANNGVGLFRDCDLNPLLCALTQHVVLFSAKANPLVTEHAIRVIDNGQSVDTWDNFHQSYAGYIDEPGSIIDKPEHLSLTHFKVPGCPECVHTHWRWSAFNGDKFNNGRPLIPEGSNQDVDIGVSLFRDTEEDPGFFAQLVDVPELISGLDYIGGSSYIPAPRDVVFWYSSTGHLSSDTFSPTVGSFFNPSDAEATAVITDTLPDPPSGGHDHHHASSLSSSTTDIPVTVTFGHRYADGPTGYAPVDPVDIGTLPDGYTIYNADAFLIGTGAMVSGPHVVTFNVPSVVDEGVFNSLRVLHLVPDEFDLEVGRYVDTTVLSPGTPAPDFANRTISARADGLGQFVLATKESVPPNTDIADLSVTVADSSNSVTLGNDLTYTITLHNAGPQTADEVMLKNSLPAQSNFVSVNTTTGTCREYSQTVVCTVPTLASGADATVTVVVKPTDAGATIPAGGITLRNTAMIKSNDGDNNLANNTVIEATTLLPDSNAAPFINITSPVNGTKVVGPANIVIDAEATDSDGSIAAVEFYEHGELLGTGTLVSGNQYTFTWNNPDFGPHSIIALAEDNNGKVRFSTPINVLVNGSATVAITSPVNGVAVNRPGDVLITATASVSTGTIDHVHFYANGALIGDGTLSAGQYSFTWSAPPAGTHLIQAVVVDDAEVETMSATVNVIVNDAPVVALTSPATGTLVASGVSSLTLTANASDFDGTVRRVDFYANGTLIGANADAGVNQFSFVWTNPASGTYSLTAKAIDNYDAITTSSPITIRINSAPAGTLLTPSDGTQFTAPGTITLLASATDADGTISQVEFRANGYRVGVGTPVGGNQYQFVWNNVGIGLYGFTVWATDNDGSTTGISGTTVTVSAPVLFVTNSTTLNTSDAAIKTRLEDLGYTVTVKDASASTTADADGKAVVVISSTVSPNAVGTKFRTVTVPVVLWDSGLFVNMGMTTSGNQNSGTTNSQTQVRIVNAAHPLAAGLPNNTNITVSASNAMSWGKPNANASSVATLVSDATKAVIFGYETGLAMPGLTAPARRVGLYMTDNTAASFTTNGGNLFDAAIKWATGGSTLNASFVSLSPGPVNLTNEGTMYWTHWGNGSATQFDHKDQIAQLISGYTRLGTTAAGWFSDNVISYNWTNGTPTISTTGTTTGVLMNDAVGNGFEITVPADTNLKTLKLYVGAWWAQGKLEASLTDGSAPVYIDTTVGATPGLHKGVYTIVFKSASPWQTLRLRYTLLTNHFAPFGNVTLESATLQ